MLIGKLYLSIFLVGKNFSFPIASKLIFFFGDIFCTFLDNTVLLTIGCYFETLIAILNVIINFLKPI